MNALIVLRPYAYTGFRSKLDNLWTHSISLVIVVHDNIDAFILQ